MLFRWYFFCNCSFALLEKRASIRTL
jgi:hypothetical protein